MTTEMIKPKLYKNTELHGEWLVTFKIDGVRILRNEQGQFVTRANNPVFNTDLIPENIFDAEIYVSDLEASVDAIKEGRNAIKPEYVYNLCEIDSRLVFKTIINPTKEDIKSLLNIARKKGFEGLVLRQGKRWLKVKPRETIDLEVTCINVNEKTDLLSSLSTKLGKVASGYNDYLKKALTTLKPGFVIEVEYMELTKHGQLRHAAFKRIREDKNQSTNQEIKEILTYNQNF